MSEGDFYEVAYKYAPQWHEPGHDDYQAWISVIQLCRYAGDLSDEQYEQWAYESGWYGNPDIDRWRQELIYLREIERLRRPRTMPIARIPQQPSLFDRAQVDGEGVYIHSDGTAAKIGRTAVSERQRRRSHQTGNPRDLVLLAWLPGASEAALLERFFHLHIRGEWFRLEPELLEFIRAWQLVEGVFE